MHYRLKPYEELLKTDFIYRADYSGVMFTSKRVSTSWMLLPPDCFEITYKIGHNLTLEVLEEFSEIFTVINNDGDVMSTEENKEKEIKVGSKDKQPKRYDLNEVMPEKEKHPKPEKIVD